MSDIFCDEPIIAVYEGEDQHAYAFGANSFLDCYHELSYHVTDGHRLILETESFYISLSAEGITKSQKACSLGDLRREGEYIEPFIHHQNDEDHRGEEYPSVLFVGERLLSVGFDGECHLLRFDDFDLKVVSHALNENDFPSLNRKYPHSYFHVLGADRHIKSRCFCGGKGELLLDFLDDYVVRCDACKRSTSASIHATDAIRDWEEKYIECDLSDITIE